MALYSVETFGELEPFVRQEWLITNGLGGFASSTVVGCNARRYHGLLTAATLPPVGRVVTLSRMGEMLILDGDAEHPHELAVNQFKASFHPRGDQYLRKFEIEDHARWAYDVAGVRVTKEVLIPWMKNVVGIRYTVEAPAGRGVELRLYPFVALRDFHGLRHAAGYDMTTVVEGARMRVTAEEMTLHLRADGGRFVRDPKWWYGHVYAIEVDRGFEETEDLFNPGYLEVSVVGNRTVTVWGALEDQLNYDFDAELKRRRETVTRISGVSPDQAPGSQSAGLVGGGNLGGGEDSRSLTIEKLKRAANDFVVYRKDPDGSQGRTVIAGYPWFSDWGRDTMIALPGLFLVTRRFEEAKQVLSVFAKYVSEGMIPNRFNDYTNEPEYNTVDASLWFVHACFEYLKTSEDRETFEKVLRPACAAIIEGYKRGTRYNIRMEEDGLVTQGDANTQLTWMDARCDGVSFTPREGKPVEINALWYHALVLMGETALAAKVQASFRKAFWISAFRGLADVVQGGVGGKEYQRDVQLRPNQIFAVSLTKDLLLAEQQATVVEVVRRELLTPVGLRSLARSDRNYKGRFSGGPFVRDQAYHNGTVWGWLIGPFLEAYLRVHENSADAVAQARRWLSPMLDQMDGACLGQIAEVFEGDEPHRAVGCCAQAWSVSEVLRLAVRLGM
ncbi:MAG TPA: amylo-alpha-1,6-glucosidase [Tepidisphaeraceae bacterium]|jgi:predicted glycogen debranching enzyme